MIISSYNEIEKFVKESKKNFITTRKEFYKWKEWKHDDRIIQLSIKMISVLKFQLFLNRQSGRTNFENEKGCTISLENTKAVYLLLFKQTQEDMKYKKGTSKNIDVVQGFTWELIDRIKIKDEWGDTGRAINLKLMHSKYGDKIFLQNETGLGDRNRRGVEIPYDFLQSIALEIKKFHDYYTISKNK